MFSFSPLRGSGAAKQARPPSRGEISDDLARAEVQAKAFAKWITSVLKRVDPDASVVDIFTELKDGRRLLELTEALTDAKLPREKGSLPVHQLTSLNRALDYLRTKEKVQIVNIDGKSIRDGNQKLTLGLIWTLILHFHIAGSDAAPGGAGDVKSELLRWCQETTKDYDNVSIDNFSQSWRDGRAFNALLHRFRPDLVDVRKLQTTANPGSAEAATADLKQAFTVAERELGVVSLLDAEDVNSPNPDDRSIMMYVVALRQALTKSGSPGPRAATGAEEVDGNTMARAAQRLAQSQGSRAQAAHLQEESEDATTGHSKETEELKEEIAKLNKEKKILQQQLAAAQALESSVDQAPAQSSQSLQAERDEAQRRLLELQEKVFTTQTQTACTVSLPPQRESLVPKIEKVISALRQLKKDLNIKA